MNNQKTILVTGVAGFIGYHLCEKLLQLGHNVVGLDIINDYYDINLKYARLNNLGINRDAAKALNKISSSEKHGIQMQFIRINIEDKDALFNLFQNFKFDAVCNLAAQAGVRYSIENPDVYVNTNLVGFYNILQCCKIYNVSKLVYASSSSVYGDSKKERLTETDCVDAPISLYAATKKSNELIAYAYSHLYDFETVGLRFFTVYGPWGRPDMALFLFTDAILNKKPIKVFNHGNMLRDFTYIDDIVNGIIHTLVGDNSGNSKYNIYNIGNGSPVRLMDFIEAIEDELDLVAEKEMLPMQAGDVFNTWSDSSKLKHDYPYEVKTNVSEGIKYFITWYKTYYHV
ncbi:NAD-dependent epimerase/dehydratase family protein [Thalassobellus citreus]|uniref:NAD-dependent epimerase/dehydratase family protein n=1 Tax=Thalassobellus citreus TaxID=3367752 RepID=UPI003788C589